MPEHNDLDPEKRYASVSRRCDAAVVISQRVAISNVAVGMMDLRLGANPNVYGACMRAVGYGGVSTTGKRDVTM